MRSGLDPFCPVIHEQRVELPYKNNAIFGPRQNRTQIVAGSNSDRGDECRAEFGANRMGIAPNRSFLGYGAQDVGYLARLIQGRDEAKGALIEARAALSVQQGNARLTCLRLGFRIPRLMP